MFHLGLPHKRLPRMDHDGQILAIPTSNSSTITILPILPIPHTPPHTLPPPQTLRPSFRHRLYPPLELHNLFPPQRQVRQPNIQRSSPCCLSSSSMGWGR